MDRRRARQAQAFHGRGWELRVGRSPGGAREACKERVALVCWAENGLWWDKKERPVGGPEIARQAAGLVPRTRGEQGEGKGGRPARGVSSLQTPCCPSSWGEQSRPPVLDIDAH